jgi:hypothetical protein
LYLLHSIVVDRGFNPSAAIDVDGFFNEFQAIDNIITNHAIGLQVSLAVGFEDYNVFYGNGIDSYGFETGTHSLIGDPLFVDPLHDDYHLLLGSPAIDHGIDAGVYTDLDGNPRPIGSGFDIGAYEFRGPFTRVYLPLVYK